MGKMIPMVPVNFTSALRCIAQDLDRRGLKTFEIAFDGTKFTAQCGYQEPPSATPVELLYNLADLKDLDKAGLKKRGKTTAIAEFLNQVQVLRTIGGFLDKHESRLIRLSNNQTKGAEMLFRVEYQSRDGELMVDDHAGDEIYDMCVLMYQRRRKMTGTSNRR